MSVASNAPASVTNSVTVTNAGLFPDAADTANDLTNITQLVPRFLDEPRQRQL